MFKLVICRASVGAGVLALGCLVSVPTFAVPGFGQPNEPRDPTQPPGTPRVQLSSPGVEIKHGPKVPVLTSILLSDERRLAVINDQLVREGERVAGMTLVQVGKDQVQLQGKEHAQPLILRLPKSNIGKDYR